MKTFLFFITALCSTTSLFAQSDAGGKMASGLSIALIIMFGLVIYMLIKNQKLQKENLSLRQKLQRK